MTLPNLEGLPDVVRFGFNPEDAIAIAREEGPVKPERHMYRLRTWAMHAVLMHGLSMEQRRTLAPPMRDAGFASNLLWITLGARCKEHDLWVVPDGHRWGMFALTRRADPDGTAFRAAWRRVYETGPTNPACSHLAHVAWRHAGIQF